MIMSSWSKLTIMHQSIPVVPIPPPPGISRAFAHVVIPGMGHLKFYHCPGVGHLRDDPGAFDKVRKTFRCSQCEVVPDLPFLYCCSLIDFIIS